MRHSYAALAVAVSLLTSCGDERKRAVEGVVEFAKAAPFTIGTPERAYSGYTVIVVDSGLPAFNEVFRYFEPKDTTRAALYRGLPAEFLSRLFITNVVSVTYRTARDTLFATVVFQRPDRELLTRRLRANWSTTDTAAPTEELRAAFRAALGRARSELQETDTAFLLVLPGPRVGTLRTASGIRDSVRFDSLTHVARISIERLVREAHVASTSFNDYSSLDTRTGGAVEGFVTPGDGGWYHSKSIYSGLEVECEARRDTGTTKAVGYVLVADVAPRSPVHFLCLWTGDIAAEWFRLRPKHVRIRLVGYVVRDSVFGSWITVR